MVLNKCWEENVDTTEPPTGFSRWVVQINSFAFGRAIEVLDIWPTIIPCRSVGKRQRSRSYAVQIGNLSFTTPALGQLPYGVSSEAYLPFCIKQRL